MSLRAKNERGNLVGCIAVVQVYTVLFALYSYEIAALSLAMTRFYIFFFRTSGLFRLSDFTSNQHLSHSANILFYHCCIPKT